MSAVDPEHRSDKLALFVLAGLVVLVLGGVVLGVFWRKSVPDKGDVLLGGITTGLILFLRDLVNAVRSSWEEVTRAKTNEALANSGAGPSGATGDPVHVKED
jgi:hypothetical protein